MRNKRDDPIKPLAQILALGKCPLAFIIIMVEEYIVSSWQR